MLQCVIDPARPSDPLNPDSSEPCPESCHNAIGTIHENPKGRQLTSLYSIYRISLFSSDIIQDADGRTHRSDIRLWVALDQIAAVFRCPAEFRNNTMLFRLLLLALFTLSITADATAGDDGCRLIKGVSSIFRKSDPVPVKQYYRGQDGSLRELIPYSEALSRSEDAERLEGELAETQQQLAAQQEQNAAATAQLAALQEQLEAANKKLQATQKRMQAQIADLNKKLNAEGSRAEKAEAAAAESQKSVVTLTQEQKQLNTTLTSTKNELKQVTDARDAAVVRAEKLQETLTAAETSVRKAEEEINALQKALEESQKAAEQKVPQPEAGTTEETPKVEEQPATQEPADEPAGEEPAGEEPAAEEPAAE